MAKPYPRSYPKQELNLTPVKLNDDNDDIKILCMPNNHGRIIRSSSGLLMFNDYTGVTTINVEVVKKKIKERYHGFLPEALLLQILNNILIQIKESLNNNYAGCLMNDVTMRSMDCDALDVIISATRYPIQP